MRVAFATVLLLAAGAQAAFVKDRVAVVVVDDSANPSAAAEVAAAAAANLVSKGYDVVPAADVAAARAGAELDADSAAALRKAVKADALLVVTVSFFLDSSPRPYGTNAHPAFGLRAKLYAGSGKQWRNSMGWIADELVQPAAFKKTAAPRPTARACERLLFSLPRGRRDPDAQLAAAEPAPVKLPASTRYEAHPERLRDSAGIARFPLKIERKP